MMVDGGWWMMVDDADAGEKMLEMRMEKDLFHRPSLLSKLG